MQQQRHYGLESGNGPDILGSERCYMKVKRFAYMIAIFSSNPAYNFRIFFVVKSLDKGHGGRQSAS